LSRQITPEQLHWLFSAQLVLAIALGGTRQFPGRVADAFGFVALEDLASRLTRYRGLVPGLLLVTAVLAFPEGLVAAGTRLVSRWSGSARIRARRPHRRDREPSRAEA